MMKFRNESANIFSVQDTVNESRRGATDAVPSEEEDRKSKTSLKSVIEEKLKNSSIYAVAKIGQSQSKFRRVSWLLVLMIGIVGCVFQIYRFLSLYFKYPIIVDLEIERKMVLEFPAITVCSLNGMNGNLDDCVYNDDSKWYCKEITVTSKPIQILNGYKTYEKSSLDKLVNGSIPPDENANTLENTGKSASTNTVNKTSERDRQRQNSKYLMNYGKRRSESYKKILNTGAFIQNCFFNSESCQIEHFNHFRNPKYGDCYTFKSVDKHGDPLRIWRSGMNSGLEFELNMEHGYNTQSSDSLEARIAIHDSAELPDLVGSGLSITPGFETTIALRETLIHRLPSPYKDRCVHYKTGHRQSQIDQNDCFYSCIQEWNIKMCGCTDPSLPFTDGFIHCNVSNASQSNCLKFIFDSGAVRDTCDCPLPCISKSYNEIASRALWPAETSFRRKTFQEMQRFRRSHAKLKVYYSTLERSVFHQKPMFQESELFSHLGGELGLWLGLSLIALFEVLESFICFLRILVCCCCKPKKELFY